ncbi:unnamed protein product [Debaryomyces tyrocola]|nr:unnamed protein product [Debaryomyces tyrocola]
MDMGSTTIDLSVDYDTQCGESLYKLWKVTNNEIHCPKISSTERLSNRSWRMLNQKVLLNNEANSDVMKDLYVDSLSDLKPKLSQFLSSRPSLFLNTSKSTLFSHSSKNSSVGENNDVEQIQNRSEDISDISDISDILEEDDYASSDSDEQDKKIKESTIQKIDTYDQPEPNFAFGYFPPQLDIQNKEAESKPPLNRSKTSFVRGFSPNHISIASLCSKSKESLSLLAKKDSNADCADENMCRTNRNIFYIANSPSPPQNNDNSRNSINNNSNGGHNPANKSNSLLSKTGESFGKVSPSKIKRQDSLFNNLQEQNNQEDANDDDYSSTDISEEDDDGSPDEEQLDVEDDAKNTVCLSTSNNNTFSDDYNDQPGNMSELPDTAAKKKSRTQESDMIIKDHGKSNDNDSEWLSISSEDEKNYEPIPHERLVFDKRLKPMSNNSSISTDIIPIQDNEKRGSSPPISKPRSLLSSLFLNEMASSSSASLFSTTNAKPLLKRSSTTGIITIDQIDNGSNKGNSNKKSNKINRPSILFSRKHTSLTDISKNYPHYQNDLVQKHILNDYMNDQKNEDNEGDFPGKQKSIVGVSDFNVTTKATDISNTNSINNDNSNTKVKDNEHSDNITLASSLNKYSDSLSNNSIKGLLSRSSLNLSQLFNSKNKLKKDTSVTTEKQESLEPASRNLGSSQVLDCSKSLSPSFLPMPPNSRTASTQKQNQKLDPYFKDRAGVNSNSNFNSTTSAVTNPDPNLKINPHPIAKSESNLTTNSEDSSNVNNPRSIKLSPKSTRRSMLSTELSKSLKESILIDYKLGKIPLPLKVINDGEFVNKNSDTNECLDDYHLRGW